MDERYRVQVGDRVLELDLGAARFAIRSGRGVWVDAHGRPVANSAGEPLEPGGRGGVEAWPRNR